MQLAQKYHPGEISKSTIYLAEPKYDGARLGLYFSRTVKGRYDFDILSRRDVSHASTLGFIAEQLKPYIESHYESPVVQVDGEMFTDNWRTTMHLLKNSNVAKKSLIFRAFDFVETNKIDGCDMTQLWARREKLTTLLERTKHPNIELVPSVQIDSDRKAKEFRTKFVDEGFEGLMLKWVNSPYIANSRTSAWLKWKSFVDKTGKIVGFKQGTRGTKNARRLGAVIVQLEDGTGLVSAGTGFSDDDRDEIWENRQLYLGRLVDIKVQDGRDDLINTMPTFLRFRSGK
jgi:DNA ligase-1